MKKTTIIFDLDGTLLNTVKDLKNAANYAFFKNNQKLVKTKQIKYILGSGAAKTIKILLKENINNDIYESCLYLFKDYYSKHYFDHVKPYHGITHLLNKLKNDGYKLAVATNKSQQVATNLVQNIFGNVFDCIQGHEEGMKPKPEKDTFEKIFDKLQIKPKECLYIGDTEIDELTSSISNVECILVTYGFRTKSQLKDTNVLKVNNVRELYKIIKNWD